jgi:DNA-binding MarR family transcriptional regulator
MSQYSSVPDPVKRPARTQRKQLLRLPDAMLDKQSECYPETFERFSILAMFAVRSLAQRITDYTNETLAPFGLNAAQFNYMMVLSCSPNDQMTLSDLSRYIHTSNATVTSMIGVLERDGLVKRRANAEDGRSIVVSLTAKGRRLMDRAVPIHHGHWGDALRDLTIEERAQLTDLLLRAGAGFDRHFAEQG